RRPARPLRRRRAAGPRARRPGPPDHPAALRLERRQVAPPHRIHRRGPARLLGDARLLQQRASVAQRSLLVAPCTEAVSIQRSAVSWRYWSGTVRSMVWLTAESRSPTAIRVGRACHVVLLSAPMTQPQFELARPFGLRVFNQTGGLLRRAGLPVVD